MTIKRVGSQPSAQGPPEWFTGAVRTIRCFRQPIRHLCRALASLLSRVRGLHGIRIRSARP